MKKVFCLLFLSMLLSMYVMLHAVDLGSFPWSLIPKRHFFFEHDTLMICNETGQEVDVSISYINSADQASLIKACLAVGARLRYPFRSGRLVTCSYTITDRCGTVDGNMVFNQILRNKRQRHILLLYAKATTAAVPDYDVDALCLS